MDMFWASMAIKKAPEDLSNDSAAKWCRGVLSGEGQGEGNTGLGEVAERVGTEADAAARSFLPSWSWKPNMGLLVSAVKLVQIRVAHWAG